MNAITPAPVHIVARPKVFGGERITGAVPAGQTIDEMLGLLVTQCNIHPLMIPALAVFVVDPATGREVRVPYERWRFTRPKAGKLLLVKAMPQGGGGGGGGKSPIRMIAMLAVMVIAWYAAPIIVGAMAGVSVAGGAAAATVGAAIGVSATTAAIMIGAASVVVSMIGNALVNALLPANAAANRGDLGTSSFTSSPISAPSYALTGTRNRSNPYGVIPKIYGRRRVYPLMGARTYSEVSGNDQYLRAIFCFGYGPLQIEDLSIGNTPITAFTDLEYELRYGYEDDEPTTLFSNSVREDALNIALTQSTGYATSTETLNDPLVQGGGWVEATTAANTDRVACIIDFPSGLGEGTPVFTPDPDGPGGVWTTEYAPETVAFEVEVDKNADGNWSAATPTTNVGTVSGNVVAITRATGSSFSVTIGEEAPRATFKVRIRRQADTTGATSTWASMQSVTEAWTQRTSYSNANELSVDISFPRGLTKFEQSGSRSSLTVTIEIQYRAVGATDWIAVRTLDVTDNSTSAVRVDHRWTVTEGQYEIRMRRVTADQTESQYVDSAYWTALRTITSEHPIAMPGLALLAVRIKASEQLNGPLDTVNAICTSILPTWNGTSWDSPSPQRNPAWAFCDVLRGPANKRPIADSFIDLPAIKEWADACDAVSPQGDTPSWTYDAVHDSRSTVEATLREIAATCRARYVQSEGKYSIVRDVAQTTPWQHFTPRNSSGFKATRNFIEHPHALRCRFVNPDKDWQEDEVIVYSDGYSAANATVFEQVDMLACTRPAQAWREGRYHMGAAKLRPASYELSTDVEHLVCKAGDLVKVAWDVPIWGAGTGRIVSVTLDGTDITAVTVDTAFTMTAGRMYNIRVRKADNTSVLLPIVTAAGETSTLTLSPSVSVASGPEVGDIVMFGEVGQEAVNLIVKEVQRGDELTARIILVDAAPAVHSWYSGALPAFESQISDVATVARQASPTPVIAEMWDDEVLDKGTVVSRTYIRTTAFPAALVPARYVEAWYRPTGSTTWLTSGQFAAGTNIELADLADGQPYTVQVRSISEYGITSEWATTTYTPVGLAAVPEDVTNFRVTVLDTTAYLSWDAVSDVDLSHYALKWSPLASGATWGSAQTLIPKVTGESVTVPAMQGAYLVKAVDYSASESANAALVSNEVSGILSLNAVATITESPTFAGAKMDVDVVSGALELVSLLDFDGVTDVDGVLDFDLLGDALTEEGIYEFAADLDLGAVFTSRLTAVVSATGVNYVNNVDSWLDVDVLESWDGDDPTGWEAELQVRTTTDDPGGSPTWSAWQAFVIGDYSARAFQWRVVLRSLVQGITPSITGLTVTVDMPDRLESASNVSCPVEGVTVTFSPPFRVTPAVATADQNMATGDYKAITSSSETGFDIRFYNAAGTPVARTFDWVARGYGYAN